MSLINVNIGSNWYNMSYNVNCNETRVGKYWASPCGVSSTIYILTKSVVIHFITRLSLSVWHGFHTDHLGLY